MNHDFYADEYLADILNETRSIALVGASANPSRPSHGVLAFLKERGYRMFPVNPGLAGQTLLGLPVYASLKDLPEPVDMMDIFRNVDALQGLIDEVLALPWRPNVIWTQLDIRDDKAAARAEYAGIKVVMDRCPRIEIPRLKL